MPQKVQFIKSNQPKFIQQFKERVGLTQKTSINDKFQEDNAQLDDQLENEDEKPVIVLPENSDVTEEELKRVEESGDGKMRFRKPANKRSATQGLSASSKKVSEPKDNKRRKTNSKKVKSATLLSFNEDEEEEF